jgi:hypothetical protein
VIIYRLILALVIQVTAVLGHKESAFRGGGINAPADDDRTPPLRQLAKEREARADLLQLRVKEPARSQYPLQSRVASEDCWQPAKTILPSIGREEMSHPFVRVKFGKWLEAPAHTGHVAKPFWYREQWASNEERTR